MFTCFQLRPSKKVYGQKYHFFKCWRKVNKEILQVPEHRKKQLWLIFNENVKLFVFLFWRQNDSWPPLPLFMSTNFGFKQYFLAVNWALKWTKTLNFGCIPFEPKWKILKDFSNTVFVLLEEYFWSKSQQDRTIFGGVRSKIPKRGSFHRCWINTKNFENF